MKTLVFLLEEKSARVMLEGFLPSLELGSINVKYIVFDGKQDLEKSVERRLRGWLTPDTYFVILRDQDCEDCLEIKNNLIRKAEESGRTTVLVRIACRELESWYLGCLAAVEAGLGIHGLSRQQQNKKYRAPDDIAKPSHELQKLTRNHYQKISGSRQIGPHLNPDQNCSRSFTVFVSGLKNILTA